MTKPEQIRILKQGEYITAEHYAGVTRAAHRSVTGSGGTSTGAGGIVIDTSQRHKTGVFQILEAPTKRTVNDETEVWFSCKCAAVHMAYDLTELVPGESTNTVFYVYFPVLQDEDDIPWDSSNGTMRVNASFVPRIGRWVSDWRPTQPRIAFANEHVDYNTEGEFVWANIPSGDPNKTLTTVATANTFTASNPYNGKLLDGTRVEVAPYYQPGDTSYRWVVTPMRVIYRGVVVEAGGIGVDLTGTVEIHAGAYGSFSGTGEEVEVANNWLHGNDPISNGKKVIIEWDQFYNNWIVIGAECE